MHPREYWPLVKLTTATSTASRNRLSPEKNQVSFVKMLMWSRPETFRVFYLFDIYVDRMVTVTKARKIPSEKVLGLLSVPVDCDMCTRDMGKKEEKFSGLKSSFYPLPERVGTLYTSGHRGRLKSKGYHQHALQIDQW